MVKNFPITDLIIKLLTEFSDLVTKLGRPNFKNFHFDNQGAVTTTGNIAQFGYWENMELYPNEDDYNSKIDYDNNPLSTKDLRNTPIKYHRMPSIDSIGSFNDYNNLPNSGNQDKENFYKLGIKVINFDSIIPNEIKTQIQGYRLCAVKRDFGNSYVLGNWIATRRGKQKLGASRCFD